MGYLDYLTPAKAMYTETTCEGLPLPTAPTHTLMKMVIEMMVATGFDNHEECWLSIAAEYNTCDNEEKELIDNEVREPLQLIVRSMISHPTPHLTYDAYEGWADRLFVFIKYQILLAQAGGDNVYAENELKK